MKVLAACEFVFVAEGILNLVSGFLLTFFPSFVMTQQGLPSTDDLANGNLAQFGTLVLLLGYLGVRARAKPRVIEALLLGDVLWVAIFYRLVTSHYGPLATWTLGSHFSMWITVFLGLTRTTYLITKYSGGKHKKQKQHNNNNKKKKKKKKSS